MTPTPFDLAAAQALCDAASPGPWQHRNLTRGTTHEEIWTRRAHERDIEYIAGTGAGAQARADADFIAAARTGWPAALDEIERLQAEVSRLARDGERLARIDLHAGRRCESGMPECGPVEYEDTDGVPLCAVCWEELCVQASSDDDDTPARAATEGNT